VISKKERIKFYSAKKYYVTKLGYDSIPEKVLKKWSPSLREYARLSVARKAHVAEYGRRTNKVRYQEQKQNNRTVDIKEIRHLQIVLIPGQSKNWMAKFTKASHRYAKSANTTDEQKAIVFAKKWYKEKIVPMLQNNSSVKVLDFVKQKCTLLGKSKWNSDQYGFLELSKCSTKQSGVYVIIHGNKIQKVGKADGVRGLQARLGNYASSNKSRITGKYVDQFTVRLNEKMNYPELKGKSLSFYYYEIPKKETTLEGFKVQTCMARSFEKELSIQARLQGHPMTLSGTD